MIDWKEAARHFWRRANGCHQKEVYLKRRLRDEIEKRATLVNTLTDFLMDIAYDEDDTELTYCNVCHRSLIEESGHQPTCLYVRALTSIVEAGVRPVCQED